MAYLKFGVLTGIISLFFFQGLGGAAQAAGLDEAFALYRGGTNVKFNAERGRALWEKKFPSADGKTRECATCHGKDLKGRGKHVETGKITEPMAPSVNKRRFSKLRRIEKWFKRNCTWVLGRECTNQEKGDVLSYLSRH